MDQTNDLVIMRNLRFHWPGDQNDTLDIAEFRLKAGDHQFLMGGSGSGKTTLLNIIGGVCLPQHGEIRVMGKNLSMLSGTGRDRLRADHIGFIFQQFNLIPYLNALENIVLPCRFSTIRTQRAVDHSGSVVEEARRLFYHLFDQVRPDPDKPVFNMSVGQQQRVAAARALIGTPELVIADEPTSSLDYDTRERFMDLLLREVKKNSSTLLFVSHDRSLKPVFDHTLDLETVNRKN